MANFRSLDEIIIAMLDYLRITHPDLDTKPGSVARDISVDGPASEISKLYIELREIQNLSSIAAAEGTSLDALARNFGLVRSVGATSSGVVVLTTDVLDSDILIPAGSTMSSRNGITFSTLSDITMEAAKANVYRSNAIRMRTDLELAGISDQYAIEVVVESTTIGTSGNVGKYSIVTASIPSISNLTNIVSFSGGTNVEDDDTFKARVLGIFSGSNIGTTVGYINILLALSAVTDVLAIEPGDPLMVRDGTDVEINDAGERIVTSSGTGGKVDLYILGSILNEFTESYIFQDVSGKNDPTDPLNDFILGQRGVNPLLDFQQKKRLLISEGTLPFQPVNTITTLSGSLSGTNFVEKYVDANGQTRGSFELLKDTGNFSGSPFGLDRIHFISNQIELVDESIAKGTFNGEDALDYTDVQEVVQGRQLISLLSEHPEISTSDRSLLTLKHTPISITNTVLNLTTGQRYTIINQNVDGISGELNVTGRIQISGGTLPTANDILQVNYIWDKRFDPIIDFDNLTTTSVIRTTQDSLDWGFSNQVIEANETVLYSVTDGYHVIMTHPISRLINVNKVLDETISNVLGKLTVSTNITSIVSVKDLNGKELFYTKENNGSFSSKEITLPTDTISENGDSVVVKYNALDLYDTSASFNNSIITLGDTLADAGADTGDIVYVNYVANVNNLLPNTSLINFPVKGNLNNFIVSNNIVGNQPITNNYVAVPNPILTIGDNITRNLRYAPSYLKMDMQGILATGRFAIKGTSFTKIEEIITVKNSSLIIDVSDAIKAKFGVSTLPSTGYLAFVKSIEKVTLTNELISSTDFTFDVLNQEVKDNAYGNGISFKDATLSTTEIKLVSTTKNLTNIPVVGEKLHVVCYWVDIDTTERVTVSTSGIQYSKNKYTFIDTISIESGFISTSGSIEGSITINNFNQPTGNSNYLSSYNFTAPKEGERITVTYNYNRLLTDAMFELESVRPVTADVLVKAAVIIPVDVSVNIVAQPDFTGGDENLKQNVLEAITNFLTSRGLGAVIDNDDLIVIIHDVVGVDRTTLTKFNLENLTGVKQTLTAENNQYFSSGVVEVIIETR